MRRYLEILAGVILGLCRFITAAFFCTMILLVIADTFLGLVWVYNRLKGTL